jgi:Subtilase family
MKKIYFYLFFLSLLIANNAHALTILSQTYNNDVETVTYTNGTSATFNSNSSTTTWGSDHVTKTITYSFADGTSNVVVSNVKPTKSAATYIAGVKTYVLTYGDGYNPTVTINALSSTTTWGSDHMTKTTTYTFGDGTITSDVRTVKPTKSAATYIAGVKSYTLTYGDGYSVPITINAQTSTTAWGSDHMTKTITYTFGDGTITSNVSVVQPTSTGVVLSDAQYPSNWTTGGIVTKPNVSALINHYGDGSNITIENGSALLPFNETTLQKTGITDPNAVIKTPSNIIYDLSWGTPDTNGPSYANLYANSTSTTLTINKVVMGYTVNGYIYAPNQEILDAWNHGWTGKGKNILMVDEYDVTAEYGHGVTTMILANRYAAGATMFGVDITYDSSLRNPVIMNYDGTNLTSTVNMDVVNLSFTFTPQSVLCNNACGTIPSLTDYNNAIDSTSTYNNLMIDYLSGNSSVNYANLSNAVIVKSAGNGAIDSKYDVTTLAFSKNQSILNRLLVVGALDSVGTVSNHANLAYYSNVAGIDPNIQSHFLLENGGGPGNYTVNNADSTTSSGSGTSYAAPRVAGDAAIVMQKFPNLSAVSTTNLLLQTARYDTLSCYYTASGCPPSIYGQGEVSLSRALAPVGKLR